MATEQDKDQAVYVRDILPQNLKDLFKEPDCDIDKALLYQIKVVSKCKKNLTLKRTEMLKAIGNEYVESNYEKCGPFDTQFLKAVLKDVEKDEAEARRKVLGEQESVEMFKSALASNLVSEDYLSAARAYRDNMTKQLRVVVEGREILLIALEILHRLTGSHTCSYDYKMESLKTAYKEAKETHLSEMDMLERLTEWKKNPNMYITDDDEFFTFFNEGIATENGSDEAPQPGFLSDDKSSKDSELSSALSEILEEKKKLIHFKVTKVDSIDKEFEMLAEIAYDILKHDGTIKEISSYFQQQLRVHIPKARTSVGMQQYVNYLRSKHPKLKFKVSTKGYNFSLKVMRRTKSVMSLAMLSTLLDTAQDIPEEVLEAQEKFSILSNAVKRVCSMYGRCTMAFTSFINKEKELDTTIKNMPKENYAESLRVSGHFAANMKEVRRAKELIDNMKRTADSILEDVVQASGESKSK